MVKETNYIMGLWGIVKQVPCTSCFGTNNSTALYDYGDQTPKKPKQFSHLSQLLLFIDIFFGDQNPHLYHVTLLSTLDMALPRLLGLKLTCIALLALIFKYPTTPKMVWMNPQKNYCNLSCNQLF